MCPKCGGKQKTRVYVQIEIDTEDEHRLTRLVWRAAKLVLADWPKSYRTCLKCHEEE